MAFQCPECLKSSLEIVSKIELRYDEKWDEIALQLVRCNECGFRGIATYQENRWGSLDSEIVHHYGYHAAPELWEQLQEKMKTCPTPGNDSCECPCCVELNLTNEAGVWNWLESDGVADQVGAIFAMTGE